MFCSNEIYNNKIVGHKTIGTAIASYYITERPWKNKAYDPYTTRSYTILIFSTKSKAAPFQLESIPCKSHSLSPFFTLSKCHPLGLLCILIGGLSRKKGTLGERI